MRRNRFLLILATCLLSVAIVHSQSSAKDCGGDVQCECGDTVRGQAVLQANLGVCLETGLFVASGALLDCDHHTITGRGQEAGVLFDTANGAEVRNCSISNFLVGVRVKGGQGHAIVGNEILNNERYGIDLADAAAGVRIESNTIRDSGDEGIHVGTGAIDNLILGNQFLKSKAENVYLLAASGTRVIGNVMVDSDLGRAGIFIKHSTNSYVADNIVFDNPIQVRGGSRDNALEDNALRGPGSGYVFEALLENAALTYPQNNQVTAGTVFHAEKCVELKGAYDNLVQGLTVGDCSLAAVNEVPSLGLEPPFRNVVDLAMTDPSGVAGRAAVQVSTTSRALHAGDVLSLGLAVHHNNSVALDLYVGLFLPDNQIAFFSGQGAGGVRLPPAAPIPMQRLSKGSSLTLPRFLEVALPPGVPSGTYQFFAALVTPDALSDGVVTPSELAAFDLEQFTIAP
jgi:parallel beta-helix repeat protein